MDFGIYAGNTSKTIYLRLRDSTTGLGKTGLVFNSGGATASYTLPLAARAAITLASQTVTGAWSSGGFVEVDATNCKGLYRLDLPNAAIASGDYTIISIEFDGIIEESMEIPLHFRQVDLIQIGSVTQSATDLKDFADTGYDPGTNKVQGVVLVDTVTTYTGNTVQTGDTFALASGAAGFVAIDTVVDAIKVKTDFLPSAAAGTAGGVFIAGTNAATTITTSFTTTFTGNLTGSVASVSGAVGSVTGAVGSVAGNVDGNVTGSVGSLVGHTVQTGDSFARIGAAGASLTDLGSMSNTMKAEVNAQCLSAVLTADPPTNLEMTTAFTEIKGATWASGTDTLEHIRDKQTDIETALADGTVQVGTVQDGAIGAAAVADIFSTTNIVEAYTTDASDGTPAQLLYEILQSLTEFAIASTTLTVKKRDGTTATTYTLDSATVPTLRNRTT